MTTFAVILAAHADREPAKLAVVSGDTRLTYADLDARVTRVATRLARAGVAAGDVVSSQLANCAEALVLALAVDPLGAVHNPIATIAGPREIDFVLDQAASRVFVDGIAHELLHIDGAERGTFSGGATPFLQGAVDHPDLECYDLSSFRLVPCGGADVPPNLIRCAKERLGVRTGRGYGSTEFPSITSSAGPDEADDKRAECDGRPIGENRIRLSDGEIEAIGPELFLSYLDSALDADAFTSGGSLRTGDLGTIDSDGYLTVTGRAKDVVMRHGEKIPAKDVEAVVALHPSVAQVAIVALPDPRTGERACACIVTAPGTPPPSLAELTEFCGARGLATRRLPEQLEIVDVLPQTPGGKVDKRALRSRLHR